MTTQTHRRSRSATCRRNTPGCSRGCWIAQRRLARGLHRFGISAGGGEADAAVAALCTHDHANEHPAAPGDRSPVHRLRRGDGLSVGPGTERAWTAVAIDDETPWVRDYRGLWGYDTRDPFGGERAPAGPRYERDGSTRLAWDRPVAWAGLGKVSPTPSDESAALQRRAGEVELELRAAQVRLADEVDRLRSLHEGMRALAAEGAPAPASYVAAQTAVAASRDEIARLSTEQQAVANALVTPLPPEPVHAHLRHRALPTKMYCAQHAGRCGSGPPSRCPCCSWRSLHSSCTAPPWG